MRMKNIDLHLKHYSRGDTFPEGIGCMTSIHHTPRTHYGWLNIETSASDVRVTISAFHHCPEGDLPGQIKDGDGNVLSH